MAETGEGCGTFGDLVRRARQVAGLKQAELAERLGVTFQFVSAIERGKPLSAEERVRWAEVLGIDPALAAPELSGAIPGLPRPPRELLLAVDAGLPGGSAADLVPLRPEDLELLRELVGEGRAGALTLGSPSAVWGLLAARCREAGVALSVRFDLRGPSE